MSDKQLNILFIVPRSFKPELPNFSGKYSSLPANMAGQVVMQESSDYDEMKMGSSTLHTIPIVFDEGKNRNVKALILTVMKSLSIHRKTKIDVIVTYDPLLFGIAGAVVKFLTKARLIIEMNGHLMTAAFINKMTLNKKIKKIIYKILIGISMRSADGIKFVNRVLVEEYRNVLIDKKCFVFGDYVPNQYFRKNVSDGKYIFFAGFPYYLKGVDLLIKAFLRLAKDFPEYRLLIMGFNIVDLDKYVSLADDCKQIEFLKPVFHDQVVAYFENCSFFVLPSRTEGLPRVLIEAMSCGKAVVASNVGGIPEVVKDCVTGLLFESENVDQLEHKMRRLLSDPVLRERMGIAGYEKMEREYSSRVYMEKFEKMIEMLCSK